MSWGTTQSIEIHQTWKDANTLTPDMRYSISEWKRLHPRFTHILWDDRACDTFMRTQYPEFYPTYDDLPFGVQKADMFRIAVLHARGGIYADTDVVPNVAIDESPLWTRGDLVFASWETNQTNAFIISKKKRNPLLIKCIHLMIERHRRCCNLGLYNSIWRLLRIPLIIYTTGPRAIRTAIGRDSGVYYIPLKEWTPCDRCIEYTDKCPENTGRYFNHLNGKVWNTSVEYRQNQLTCILKYHWQWMVIVFVFIVYRRVK